MPLADQLLQYGMGDGADILQQPIGNPRTLSNRIQQVFGASDNPPVDSVQQVLAKRFEPNYGDFGKAAVQTLMSGSPVSGQDVASERGLSELLTQQKFNKLAGAGGSGGDLPSDVRSYQFFSGLSPDEQNQFLTVKRAAQVLNLGGTQAVRGPMGGIAESYTVTPRPEEMPEFRAQQEMAKQNVLIDTSGEIERQKARGTARGRSEVEALSDLPNVELNANQVLQVIDNIEKSPGIPAIVGAPNPLKGRVPFIGNVPGTPAADAQALIEQLEGSAFLQAYESLRGAAGITNIEGIKGQQAIARMQTAQSEKEFYKALAEFKTRVQNLLKIARDKAERARNADNQPQTFSAENPVPPPLAPNNFVNDLGVDFMPTAPAPAPVQRLRYNPATGEFE